MTYKFLRNSSILAFLCLAIGGCNGISPTSTQIPATETLSVPTLDEFEKYQLQPPDPQRLIEVAYLALSQHRDNSYLPTETPQNTYLYSEASKVLSYIDWDFSRYYPEGPVGANLGVVDHAVSLWGSVGIPGWVKTYLTSWAIQTINSQKLQFDENQKLTEKGVTFVPHPINLDGDAEMEWLVEVSFERKYDQDYTYEYYTWLLLKSKADGSYSVLPNEIPTTFQYADWEHHPDIQLDLSHDLNGDGIKDVLPTEMSYFAGGVSGFVYIYFWNGTSLSYVDQIRLPSVNSQYGERYQSSFSVADSNQDGREEIHVTWPRFAEFGCTWDTAITYQWDGEKFNRTSQNEDIPIDSGKTECFISKALWSTSPEDKTFWFEEALRSLPSDASPDLVSWVYLRLMVAYLGQGKDAEAQQTLQNLVKNRENGNFTEAVRKAIKNAGTSPLEVCKKIHDQASELAKEYQYFNSDIDGYLAYGGYPLSHEPGPNKVCPYDELPFDRLLSRQVSAEINPVEGFGKAGFELRFAQTLNADVDPELEWLAFYEDRLTIFDSISGEWRAEFIRNIENLISIQAVARDITGDQLPDILVVAELSEPSFSIDGPCQTGDNNYSVVTIDLSKEGYERVDINDYDCQSDLPPDLSTEAGVTRLVSLAKDYGSDGQKPDWYYMVSLPGKPDSAPNIYDYVRSIEKDILSGVELDPSRSKIIALLDYIPADDLQGLALRHQLQYLLGLSYEIEESKENAVGAYLELIEEAPDSMWTKLALTRLSSTATAATPAQAPTTPPTLDYTSTDESPAPDQFSVIVIGEGSAKLSDILPAEAAKAAALGRDPYIEFYADWCPPCNAIKKNLGDPLMVDAFAGTYIIKLDTDVWGSKLHGTGLYVPGIPAFYELGADGMPTGRMITGAAWGEDIPANIAPPMKAFFEGK